MASAEIGHDALVDLASEETFQAPDDLSLGSAVRRAACDVINGRLMVPHADDDGSIERWRIRWKPADRMGRDPIGACQHPRPVTVLSAHPGSASSPWQKGLFVNRGSCVRIDLSPVSPTTNPAHLGPRGPRIASNARRARPGGRSWHQLEMHHETRLIPIGAAAPSQVGAPSVMGSSRGHWEGDTLVVDTTNLSRGVDGSTRDVRVTERFSRVGPEMLQYEYTLDDPSTWMQPWTARIFLRPAPGTGVIYEYACHEGNYAAELSLRSTRAAEATKE